MEYFDEGRYFLGIFVDLLKASNAVDQEIVIKKRKVWNMRGKFVTV